MIELDDEQIENIRKGIETELSQYLGYSVLVRVKTKPNGEIGFAIDTTLSDYKTVFDEICDRHINRVAKNDNTDIS